MANISQPRLSQVPNQASMAVLNSYSPRADAGSDARKKELVEDGFVALDIGELSQQNDLDSPQKSARASVAKSLTRKASSLRNGAGGDRHHGKAATAAADGDAVTPGGAHGSERSPLAVHVSVDGEGAGFSRPATPTSAGAKSRRVGSGRRPSPWLDPRKVLLVFASLSSMGSLILLYFMLSLGKMRGGDVSTS